MSTVTENDLRELKDLINDRFNELRLNQEKIMTRLEDWKPSHRSIKSRIYQKK